MQQDGRLLLRAGVRVSRHSANSGMYCCSVVRCPTRRLQLVGAFFSIHMAVHGAIVRGLAVSMSEQLAATVNCHRPAGTWPEQSAYCPEVNQVPTGASGHISSDHRPGPIEPLVANFKPGPSAEFASACAAQISDVTAAGQYPSTARVRQIGRR